MKRVREIFFIAVLFVGMLSAAGCTTSSPGPTPDALNISLPATNVTESPVVTRYQLEKAGLFINFTPVSDTCLGDIVTFSGTTNLPAGKHLTLEIYPVRQQHCQRIIYPCRNPETVNAYCCYAGFNRTVTIIPGRDGINSFSFAVNTSESDFRPETYFIGTTDTFAWGEFTILQRMESSPPWIATDTVPPHQLGDTITFRGSTNLLPGDFVTVRIQEPMVMCAKCRGDLADSVAGCCGGFNRTVAVRRGECGNNLWSLDVNTSEHDFRADGDYWIGMYGRGNGVQNSSFFTVSGIPQPNISLNNPANESDLYTLRFSGQANTGNGPGEELFLTLSSDSGRKARYTVPVYRNGTGYSWTFSVRKSDIFPYNFLTVNVSSQTSPAISIERVFMYSNEPAYYPYNPTGP